jgi:hypothetical protein
VTAHHLNIAAACKCDKFALGKRANLKEHSPKEQFNTFFSLSKNMKVKIQICGGDATKVLFQLSIAMEGARNWRKQTGGQLVEVIRSKWGRVQNKI